MAQLQFDTFEGLKDYQRYEYFMSYSKDVYPANIEVWEWFEVDLISNVIFKCQTFDIDLRLIWEW